MPDLSKAYPKHAEPILLISDLICSETSGGNNFVDLSYCQSAGIDSQSISCERGRVVISPLFCSVLHAL